MRSDVIARRFARLTTLVETITAERADDRVGSVVDVLIESVDDDVAEGRGAHQAPEVDGAVTVRGAGLSVGDLVACRVTSAEGVDLHAVPVAASASVAPGQLLAAQ